MVFCPTAAAKHISHNPEPMAASNIPLPLACDDILVSFELSDQEHVWWRATVEEIHTLGRRGQVLATATILYESAHSYPAERVNVSFMRRNIIRPVQSVLKGDAQESSWKLHENSELVPENVDVSRTRPRMGMKRATGNAQGAAAVTSGLQETRNVMPEIVGDMNERVHQNTENMERLWDSMARRLQALERGLSELRNCDHRTFINERVKAVRVALKVNIIQEIQRPLRRSLTRRSFSTISGNVTRMGVNVSQSCDWGLFKLIARDVFESAAAPHVVFLPSYIATQHSAHDVDEAGIIFRSAWSLFHWLGIWSESEKRSLLITHTSSKQNPAMRLLGGMQWDEEDLQQPLNIFIGSSCKKTLSHTTTQGNCHRAVLHSNSAQWDPTKNGFQHDLQLGKANAGIDALDSMPIDEYDSFSMTWSADSTRSRKTARLMESVGEGVRIGELLLKVPSCGVFTNTLCEKMNAMVGRLDHSSFM